MIPTPVVVGAVPSRLRGSKFEELREQVQNQSPGTVTRYDFKTPREAQLFISQAYKIARDSGARAHLRDDKVYIKK